jgi:hypothetical protein
MESLEFSRISKVHGSKFVSNYYRIYFPATIVSLIVSFVFGPRIMSSILGHQPGDLFSDDPFQSQRALFDVYIFASFITPILVILLADMEIKKNQMNYEPVKNKLSKSFSIPYLFIVLGLFFFLSYINMLIFSFIDPKLFPVSQGINYAAPDFSIIFITRLISVDPSLKSEMFILLIAFFLTYISFDFIFRGLMGNEARLWKMGAGGIVLLPAFIQAITFTNSYLIFSNFTLFAYFFISNLLLGLFAGIIFWRTRRFLFVLIYTVAVFFLQPNSDFQLTFLRVLPDAFGEFNLFNNHLSIKDQIFFFFENFRFLITISAPVFTLLAYQETWLVLKNLALEFKKHIRGILVVSLAFMVIDIVFSFFANTTNPFGFLGGLFIALLVIILILPLILGLLPEPNQQELMILKTMNEEELSNNEKHPINIEADIKMLEAEKSFFGNPKYIAVLGALTYLYLLFLSGVITQILLLNLINFIRYILFFVIMPTILISASLYFYSRSNSKGYFFSESWRARLNTFLLMLFIINLLIWIRGAALVQFSWTSVPLFVAFALTIWPKPTRSPIRDFSLGLGSTGRRATFKWLEHNSHEFVEVKETLLTANHQQVVVGTYIASAKLSLLDEWELIDKLKDKEISEEDKAGIAMALGIIGTKSSEGVLLQLLNDSSIEVKKATFWALGNIGSKTSLTTMVSVLESTPAKGLVKIAENAILKIDPNYPLSGLRDPLTMTI